MCVVETQVQAGAFTKICHAHIPTCLLGIGIQNPLGVVETQVYSWGTLEKISTYISSHKYMHVHTRLCFIFFVFLLLQAEISPMRFNMNMNKTHPASMRRHAIAMKGTHSTPGHA